MVPGLPPPALHLLADHLEPAAVVDDGDHVPGGEAERGPLPEVADLVLLDDGTAPCTPGPKVAPLVWDDGGAASVRVKVGVVGM